MPIPQTADTRYLSRTFMMRLISHIMEERRPGETASRRLKQAGLMSCIYTMHLKGEAVTVTKLCDRIKAPRNVVVEIVKALESRGFLKYRANLHDGGRGRVYVYSLTEKAEALSSLAE